MTLREALARVRGYRYLAGTEDDLQRQLAEVLAREGITFERECQKTAADRLDFYLPAYRAAVEVKIAGSPAEALRQLHRYAGLDSVDALVLVTQRARLGGLPSMIGGKPLHILCLWEGAL